MDAERPIRKKTSAVSRACSLEGLGCLGMCRQRRRTWGQGWPWAGLRARMKRHCAAPGFPRCGQEKAPRKGLGGSGFVHEVVLALTREEEMLPRVASVFPTAEPKHFASAK